MADDTLQTRETRPKYRQFLVDLQGFLNASSSIREVLLGVGDHLLRLLDAERVTLYAIDKSSNELYSLMRTDGEPTEIRVPKDENSLSGFCAISRRTITVANAYDHRELARLHENLSHDARWDRALGVRTRQVLCVPIVLDTWLMGVIQFINSRDGADFQRDDEVLAEEIAFALASTFYRHFRKPSRRPPGAEAAPTAVTPARAPSHPPPSNAAGPYRPPSQPAMPAVAGPYRPPSQPAMPAVGGPHRPPSQPAMPAIPGPPRTPSITSMPAVTSGSYMGPLPVAPANVPPVAPTGTPVRRPQMTTAIRTAAAPQLLRSAPYDLARLLSALETRTPAEPPPRTAAEEEDAFDATHPDAVIARLVKQIVIEASNRGASDIHFEPNGPREPMLVRIRVDGECSDLVTIPPAHRVTLVQRIKILAELDIAERRKPQDGRFRVDAPTGSIEVRVATLPTLGENEDVILRLLSAWHPMPLTSLSLTEANLDTVREMIKSPYGIILVVGPTGSGKTTTLHAALGQLNTHDTKILTVEDPVEIVQPGLRQVQVNPRIGLGYPEVLRAFLRGDPDVIMVGEMRDHTTAQIGIEAALTGHLVMSTIQSNSAPETITRLLDMEVDAVSFADALRGVVAQRLVRKLCEVCKQPYTASEAEWRALASDYNGPTFLTKFPKASDLTLYRSTGCQECHGTGYKGRVAIHEILVGTDAIKRLIRERAAVDAVREVAAREGMHSLMQDGIAKVLWGVTDHACVRAVCID